MHIGVGIPSPMCLIRYCLFY